MKKLPAQVLIGAVCLLIGIVFVTQFRSQRLTRLEASASATDQATYISQLYESNVDLQQQASQLQKEVDQYQSSDVNGKSNLDSMVADLQNLRMANGEIEATGPGVTVVADGNLTAFELQDLVNELRNAGAEAMAVNGIRIVTRSAIVGDEEGRITVDRQPLARPYRLEAIGEPDTLLHALERKGGLIALMQARDNALTIKVDKRDIADEANWLKLPKTALDFTWLYGKPATP